jgi:flagellar hook-basal body complex protein FliE
VLLAGDEHLVNQYNHRKDVLYENRENAITQSFTQQLQSATADAQDARNKASDFTDKLKKATDDARDAQSRAAIAQAETDEHRKQNAYRELTAQQQQTLLSLLKPSAPQELYFVCSPDPESQHYFTELSSVLTSAGWKLEMHPYNWGTLQTYPVGVQVWVGDAKNTPRGASVLQSALTKIGVEAPGWEFFMLEKQEKFAFTLVRSHPTKILLRLPRTTRHIKWKPTLLSSQSPRAPWALA